MVNQYFGGILPISDATTPMDADLIDSINSLYGKVNDDMNKLLVPEALQEIFNVVNKANKYIDDTAPWVLAKDPSKKDVLAKVLYNLIEALRVVGTILLAFLPETAKKILTDVGINSDITEYGENVRYGVFKGGEKIVKGAALFARINIDKELAAMDALSGEEPAKKEEKAPEAKKDKEKKSGHSDEGPKAEITIDDFAKCEFRVGKILTAEKVADSRKLLKFTVDTGDRVRTIASGVAKYYTPEEMVSKSVTVVVNLKPATIGGVLSEGMILFGEDSEGVVTVEPSKNLKPGSLIC